MNTLSKKLCCILMRSGVQIWVEQERAESLQVVLQATQNHKFVRFEGETFNTADLEGVYSAQTMENLTRRKNGEWQCHEGIWHIRSEKCKCPSSEMIKRQQAVEQEHLKQYGMRPLYYGEPTKNV